MEENHNEEEKSYKSRYRKTCGNEDVYINECVAAYQEDLLEIEAPDFMRPERTTQLGVNAGLYNGKRVRYIVYYFWDPLKNRKAMISIGFNQQDNKFEVCEVSYFHGRYSKVPYRTYQYNRKVPDAYSDLGLWMISTVKKMQKPVDMGYNTGLA